MSALYGARSQGGDGGGGGGGGGVVGIPVLLKRA